MASKPTTLDDSLISGTLDESAVTSPADDRSAPAAPDSGGEGEGGGASGECVDESGIVLPMTGEQLRRQARASLEA